MEIGRGKGGLENKKLGVKKYIVYDIRNRKD